MINLSRKAITINAALAVIFLIAAYEFVREQFARPYFEVCSTRYAKQINLSLDRNGEPMSGPELQAVASGMEEGVLENLAVQKGSRAPSTWIMNIHIPKDSVEQRSKQGTGGGVSIPWFPATIEETSAACLSYNVFIPDNFDFGSGGTLPGIYATDGNRRYFEGTKVYGGLNWRSGGQPGLYINIVNATGLHEATLDTVDTQIPVGRWVRVDQELVLNTPGEPNGVIRMWLDGALAVETGGVIFRSTGDVSIAGAAGEVYFGGSGTNGKAKADADILLTPFEIRWN